MKKRFAVLKPYRYVMHLRVKKEGILDRIRKSLKRKGERVERVEKAPPRRGWGPKVFLIGGLTVAIITIIVFFLLSLTLPFRIVEVGGWKGQIAWMAVNFGSVFDRTNGLYVDAKESLRMGNLSVRFHTGGVELSGRAFLVEGPTYNVQSLGELYTSVEQRLRELGFSVERVHAQGIGHADRGDVVVVATGKPPEGSSLPLLKAAERGAVVLYIGDVPYEEITARGELKSVKNLWISHGVEVYKEEPPVDEERWNMEGGLFTMGRGSLLGNSIPFTGVGMGYLIALPNYPDLGWRSYEELAEDVGSVLTLEEVVGESEGAIDRFPTIIPLGKGRYLSGKVVFSDEEGIATLKPVRAFLRRNSVYYHDRPIIPPTSIVNKPINLNIHLAEMPAEKDAVSVLIDGERLVPLGEVQRDTEGVFPLRESFDVGIHLLQVVGEKGGLYTVGGLVVSSIDADLFPDFDKNVLRIVFKSGGAPQRLDRVTVSINGKSVSFENVREVEIDLLRLLGDVPVGTYEVVIESGGERVVKYFEKRPQTGIGRLLNTTNLLILLLSFIIYLAGIVFAKREEESYRIIVPDVVPLQGRTVKVRKEQLLDLFDKVNAFYKWRYMPLTPKEIVSGLKNGLLGEKVITSEYNVRYVLERLADKGLVEERLGYYLPKRWEKKAGFNATTLALFRRVRDLAVSKIIPFTTRISPKQPYHMKLKLLWQDVYVYFYTGREDLKYILKHAPAYLKKGLVFVVVPNEELKEDFLDAIKGPGRGQKALALALRTHNLFVMTIDELERKIKEIKGD